MRAGLKSPAEQAEAIPMAQARNALCTLVIITLAAVPLSGWLGSENGPISGHAGTGLVGELVAQLKQEDDEAEVKELAEQPPLTRQEREEARDQRENVQLKETQAQEPEPQGEQS